MGLNVGKIKQGTVYLGKYLDQTAFTNKLYNAMPAVLTSSAILYGAKDIYDTPKEKRKEKTLQNLAILGFTVATALVATRGIKIKNKRPIIYQAFLS